MTGDLRPPLDPAAIAAAAERIRPYTTRTPLKPSATLSALTGRDIYLKLESMQPTGAFKLRGASNAIVSLAPEERDRGVVTCSSGNHGRAVAWVARRLGIPATIYLSPFVPPHKIAAIEAFGATTIVAGADSDSATALAVEFAVERRLAYIHPFDDPLVIAGQGTIGLEILDDLPDVDTVIVPVSGGGLIGGIALALKARKPFVRIVGVQMERGAAMAAALRAGKPVPIVEEATIADALSGDIGLDNQYTFPLVRDLVDDLLLLSEDEIAAGMVHALMKERIVLEGAGATPIALLLARPEEVVGNTVVAVCSGDNVNMTTLLGLVETFNLS